MLTDMPSCHTRGQCMVRQSHEDVHMVHLLTSLRCTRDSSPYYDEYQRSPYDSVGYMGICMWNTGNMENTDYGQMGITEYYLMWFSFMYGLQSDYYLFLLLTTCTLFSLDIYLYFTFPSYSCSHVTSDICLTSFSVALCTLLPSLELDIGWTHIWSPPTRL